MCVYLFIHNKYTQNIMKTKTFILDAINRLTTRILTNVNLDILKFKRV